MGVGKRNLTEVIKIQALARGILVRARNSKLGGGKKSAKIIKIKKRASDKGMSDLEQKMQSARSG